jgi:hypothetical protein
MLSSCAGESLDVAALEFMGSSHFHLVEWRPLLRFGVST